MYEAFFGLRQRPFQPLPRVDAYVPLAPVREPIEALIRCVEQNQGISVLTAAPGSGKSLVCRMLQRHFHDSRRTVYLATGRFPTRRALLQAILFEMKLPYVGLSEQETRLSLLDLLQSSSAPMDRLLLIVDEAHLLNTRGLEELRTLTDYECHGQSRVSLLLSGQLELEEMLTEPAMNALNQRVGCHVCIEPLTHEESAQYIRERLRYAGNDGLSIFTSEAIDGICRASEGNPRRINQLCDHSLLLAYAEEETRVTQDLVKSALLDLRELPLHWNTPVNLEGASRPQETQNPLDAYAELHAADSEDEYERAADIDEPSARWCPSRSPSSLQDEPLASPVDSAMDDAEVGVFEFGAPLPGMSTPATESSPAEIHPAEWLFHSPEFVIPEEIQRMAKSSEPRNNPSTDTDRSVSLPPAVVSASGTPLSVFEELTIDDPYARIDRGSESATPAAPSLLREFFEGVASPAEQAPSPPSPVNHSLDGTSAPDIRDSISVCEPIEEHLLDLVEEIRGDVQRAHVELHAPSDYGKETGPAESPRGRSLRQALSWQFDVVEPEVTSESQDAIQMSGTDQEESLSVPMAGSEEQVTPENETPERRYAQLFTRLQRQRRRVEAVMNRERRSSNSSDLR